MCNVHGLADLYTLHMAALHVDHGLLWLQGTHFAQIKKLLNWHLLLMPSYLGPKCSLMHSHGMVPRVCLTCVQVCKKLVIKLYAGSVLP